MGKQSLIKWRFNWDNHLEMEWAIFFQQTMELMTPEGNLRLMIAMNIDKKKRPGVIPSF